MKMPSLSFTYRRICCLVLGSVYLVFLCCQVVYNIASAANDPFRLSHKTEAEFKTRAALDKLHGALLVKVKTRPTKRFHPLVTPVEAVPLVQLIALPCASFQLNEYQPPFLATYFLHGRPQRGPPALS